MKVQIATGNETALELFYHIWRTAPPNNWHLAVGYAGDEKSVEDIRAVFSFTHNEDVIEVTGHYLRNINTDGVMCLLLAIAEWGIDRQVKQIDLCSKWVSKDYLLSGGGNLDALSVLLPALQLQPYKIFCEITPCLSTLIDMATKGFANIREIQIPMRAKVFDTVYPYLAEEDVYDVYNTLHAAYLTLGYYEGEKLCGVIGVGKNVYNEWIAPLLFVLPEYRRRGIGTQLALCTVSLTHSLRLPSLTEVGSAVQAFSTSFTESIGQCFYRVTPDDLAARCNDMKQHIQR